MINLTTEEIEHIDRAEKALYNFIQEYSLRSLNLIKLVDSFSLKEILSKHFEEVFLNKNIDDFTKENILYWKLNSSNPITSTEIEIKDEIINSLLELLSVVSNCASLFTYLNTFEKLEPGGFQRLLEIDFLTRIPSIYKDAVTDYLDKNLDQLFACGKIDNIEKLYDSVKENLPNYKKFSLLVINPNIPKEDKIKVLKKVYRQKDYTKYKDFLRENLTDMDDVDTFIEVAVMQNNRIKSERKELAFQEIIRDIFVSGDWKYFNYERVKNLDSFSKKYIKYFRDPNFVKSFYDISVKEYTSKRYNREKDFKIFIIKILSILSSSELIDVTMENREVYVFLAEDFYKRFTMAEDDKEKKKLLDAIIYLADGDIEVFHKLLGVEHNKKIQYLIKNYTEWMKPLYKDFVFFKLTDTGNVVNNTKRYFEEIRELPVELLIETTLLEEDLRHSFGIDQNNPALMTYLQSYWYFQTTIFEICCDGVYNLLYTNYIKLEKLSDSVLFEKFKNRLKTDWFDYFLDEENVSLTVESLLANFDRTSGKFNKYDKYGSNEKDNTFAFHFVDTLSTKILPLAKAVYDDDLEKQSIILNNLNNIRGAIELISYI